LLDHPHLDVRIQGQSQRRLDSIGRYAPARAPLPRRPVSTELMYLRKLFEPPSTLFPGPIAAILGDIDDPGAGNLGTEPKHVIEWQVGRNRFSPFFDDASTSREIWLG